jgi:hypothetical protein
VSSPALALAETLHRLEVSSDRAKADMLFKVDDPELIEEFKQKWWKWLKREKQFCMYNVTMWS